MKFAIFGAGGTGGLIAARLAQAGQEVAVIARGEHLRAIQENGIHVESPEGDFSVSPALATNDPAEVGPVNAIILGVKAWQVPEASQAIRPMVGAETAVMPLQNGVDAPTQLASALGAGHVVVGTWLVRSFVVGPGQIRHSAGVDPHLQLGELDGPPGERVEAIHRAFEGAGFSVAAPPDIQITLWEKWALGCSYSGVGAVTRSPIGVWREIPSLCQMADAVGGEALAVTRARGIDLSDSLFDLIRDLRPNLPSDYTHSMHHDILAGRPSELEAFHGAVVRLGQESGVDTPVNDFIYNSLLPLEMKARGEVEF